MPTVKNIKTFATLKARFWSKVAVGAETEPAAPVSQSASRGLTSFISRAVAVPRRRTVGAPTFVVRSSRASFTSCGRHRFAKATRPRRLDWLR